MKKLFVSCIALSVLLLGANSANALSFLTDWYFDIDGTGTDYGKELVSEVINTNGYAYIQNDFGGIAVPGAGDLFTFTEVATFNSLSHDGGNAWDFLGDYELTGYFTATGSGVLGGGISFDSGTLTIYSDPARDYGSLNDSYGADNGTPIATFSLLSGEGIIDATGVPNGLITVILEATSIESGYFFDSAMGDLSLIDPIEWVMGFATTNASDISNADNNFLLEFGAMNNLPFDLIIDSGGQYRLAVVPEPSTFLLLGGGLLGLGFLGYRRKLRK